MGAAIVSARRDKTEISYGEIDYAIDRLTVGMQKTTGISFPNRQRLVAYHEAGHAVMGALTPDYDMVTKVTIIPRTNGAGGFTLFTPSEERLESGLYSKRYLIDNETVDFTEMQELVSKYHPEIADGQKIALPAEAKIMS